MKRRAKAVLIVFLVLFLIPDFRFIDGKIGLMDDWRFWNLHYTENRRDDGEWICFDALPVPKRSLAYRSLFVDLRLSLGHCEPYSIDWMNNGFSVFIGIETWGDFDIYLPLVWVMISDETNSIKLLGNGTWRIGENWIDLWNHGQSDD